MNIDLINLPEEVTEDFFLLMHENWGWTAMYETPDLEDYVCIAGPVTVTFVTNDKDKIINDAVDSMRNEIQKVRVEAEVKCNAIEEKIQSMLALPNLEKDNG